jgi:hypothetical protein
MSQDDDYGVGYRKPPKASRWRKGQSGNPRGRQKGARNLNSLFAGEGLPTPNDGIDIARIEFHQRGATLGHLGGDHGGP